MPLDNAHEGCRTLPGPLEQVGAVLEYNNGSHGTDHEQGAVSVEPDWAKFLAAYVKDTTKVPPNTVRGAAGLFFQFFMAAPPELKGLGLLKTFFVGRTGTDEMENRALIAELICLSQRRPRC
jgi:hypothetical protein